MSGPEDQHEKDQDEKDQDEKDQSSGGGEAGSRDHGERGPGGGPADRPSGTSAPDDATGVDPQGSGPESPEMPPA